MLKASWKCLKRSHRHYWNIAKSQVHKLKMARVNPKVGNIFWIDQPINNETNIYYIYTLKKGKTHRLGAHALCFYFCKPLSGSLVQDDRVVGVSWQTPTEALTHPVRHSSFSWLRDKIIPGQTWETSVRFFLYHSNVPHMWLCCTW